MTEKTNIEDIIGIVKTDEPTDSVKLKKEYYKNQSKDKRYTYLDYSRDGYIGSFFENDKPLTNKEVWDLLNQQDKEIKKLNLTIKGLRYALQYIKQKQDETIQRLKVQLEKGNDVCSICKHEYLVASREFYISKCKKEHSECSEGTVEYCDDFEFKED